MLLLHACRLPTADCVKLGEDDSACLLIFCLATEQLQLVYELETEFRFVGHEPVVSPLVNKGQCRRYTEFS